jgi:hypothetical protein
MWQSKAPNKTKKRSTLAEMYRANTALLGKKGEIYTQL